MIPRLLERIKSRLWPGKPASSLLALENELLIQLRRNQKILDESHIQILLHALLGLDFLRTYVDGRPMHEAFPSVLTGDYTQSILDAAKRYDEDDRQTALPRLPHNYASLQDAIFDISTQVLDLTIVAARLHSDELTAQAMESMRTEIKQVRRSVKLREDQKKFAEKVRSLRKEMTWEQALERAYDGLYNTLGDDFKERYRKNSPSKSTVQSWMTEFLDE